MIIRDLSAGILHNSSRGGRTPDAIVVHIMEGTMAGTLSWFRAPQSKVSAHYGVSRDGEVVQYVPDELAAWHAGTVDRPTAAIVLERRGTNPNAYTIGIENEGKATDIPTAAQLDANVQLIRLLSARYGFPINRRHVIGHREIRASKSCPGMIDVDALVRVAAGPDAVRVPRVLRRGDRGDIVADLQSLLVRLGYMEPEEVATGPGRFGPATERAFRAFLEAHR